MGTVEGKDPTATASDAPVAKTKTTPTVSDAPKLEDEHGNDDDAEPPDGNEETKARDLEV